SGGGADVDIDTALLKALNEFGQAERTMRLSLVSPERSFAQLYERLFEMQPDDPVRMIDVFFKVVSYYGYRENVAKLDWYRNGEEVLLSSLPEMPPTDPRARLDHLLRACARHDVDPIVFDRTPEQMDHVKLIKVFIPELTQPFLQSLPCLGHPRFREAARLSGVDDRLLEYEDLLQDPLPYP
ncbi:MAG TPA: YcaO-like family protein, partial [Acidimicrobiales bacterium]|nr:YcaO-like family protein [Acidimicrobiales bacterium]